MLDQDLSPEKLESESIVERCVSPEARQMLDRFCEARPDVAERVRREAETQVKILADFTLEHVDDPEHRPMYDATLLHPLLSPEHNLAKDVLEGYESQHRYLTLAVLSDRQKVEAALGALREEDEGLSEKAMLSDLEVRYGMTQKAFKERYDYANARSIDRKLEHICPQATFAYASALLYRLNRTRDYPDQQALHDIVDAQSVFVPLFQLGRDSFSMALEDSSEIARRTRAGRLGTLDKARYILGETFGINPDATIKKAMGVLFSGIVAKHVDKNGHEVDGLEMRSVVGHFSGEHNVHFYTMHGLLGDVPVRGRLRSKCLVSVSTKISGDEYAGIDLSNHATWPQDLLAGSLLVGDKNEDESPLVNMEAEEKNVVGVAKVLKRLVTYISLDSTPKLWFQSSASRKQAVHVRGDALFVDRIRHETGLSDQAVDFVQNNDHSFQVVKVTCGVGLEENVRPVNVEMQVMTRRSRKNNREGDCAHWLLKTAKSIIGKLPPKEREELDKHHDPLSPSARKQASAYLKKIRVWQKSGIASDYNTLEGVTEYCRAMGIEEDTT